MNRPLALAAALLPFVTAPALAAGTLSFTGGSAVLSVEAFVGTGIADANLPCAGIPNADPTEICDYTGSLGSPGDVLPLAGPGSLGIAGHGTAFGSDSQWSGSLEMSWSTSQAFTLATVGSDTVLTATGRHESELLNYSVGGPGAFPSRLVTVRNHQRIGFTLDATTDFTMSGLVFGEYQPVQLYGPDGQGGTGLIGNWCSVVDVACQASGTLAPGHYEARIFEFVNSDDQDLYRFGWDYQFTFSHTVAAVPEPGSVAMLALGLGVIGAWRRRVGGAARETRRT